MEIVNASVRRDEWTTRSTIVIARMRTGDTLRPAVKAAPASSGIELTNGSGTTTIANTLPAELTSLTLGNRRPLYNLLFRSAWQALREVIEEECGFQPAALMMLHTWNQRLEAHPHVHALVPGGGPSLCGRRWITSRHRRHRRKRKPYLVDNKLLSERFRNKFLAGLKRLHQRGELRLDDDQPRSPSGESFSSWLAGLESRAWVVYEQGPPQNTSSPEQVLKYLARYMTGGPISDQRLISHVGDEVTFLARSTEKPKPGRRAKLVPTKLSGVEFTRCWSLHILPKGFTKVRRYGTYSNRHCKSYLQRSRELLDLPPEVDDPPSTSEGDADADTATIRCPRCSRRMTCIAMVARPGWRVVMSGPERPFWYRDG